MESLIMLPNGRPILCNVLSSKQMKKIRLVKNTKVFVVGHVEIVLTVDGVLYYFKSGGWRGNHSRIDSLSSQAFGKNKICLETKRMGGGPPPDLNFHSTL